MALFPGRPQGVRVPLPALLVRSCRQRRTAQRAQPFAGLRPQPELLGDGRPLPVRPGRPRVLARDLVERGTGEDRLQQAPAVTRSRPPGAASRPSKVVESLRGDGLRYPLDPKPG
ncbi:hypothetical protein Snoj_20090 [Streptomyces nojiriensis]|uniref:Uncharacterized protein n=1 Tax=Streptomyces nojiriensis TaxID=66374 RepID=A0ABQ3SIX2_9ACTN|nr:hypothetical protein GCM10010205_61950 [Streptomyces nojiriensis]GHI68091.1 hypothetical protein Snoj_20090 [Streptomyces nojiriensis]